MIYTTFVTQPSFFLFLLEIDRSIANDVHSKPCHLCNGKLNWANFRRSGYGLPENSSEEVKIRFSLCCSRDSCRSRTTPNSLRFIRGMRYVTIVMLLLSAINHNGQNRGTMELARLLKVSSQTIRQWVKWWRETFKSSPFWRYNRGNFMPPLNSENLAQALLDHYQNSSNSSGEYDSAKALLLFMSGFFKLNRG